MTKPKILVVEDERVVAADIEESLHKLGYAVVGAAASGVTALRRAVETEPDLVLMDIKLKGSMDGIDTAGELHDRLGIPVVFLTAYADGEILERAKNSSPSGYVLKPFDERALRSAVEIALHRYPEERKLAESEHRLVTALRGLEDAVILTARSARITFMNKTAERLTGWKQAAAIGKPVSDVLVTLHSRTGSLQSSVVSRVLHEGCSMGLGDYAILVSKHHSETWIEGTAAPLWDDEREIVGAAVVFRAVSGKDHRETPETERARAASRLETLGRLAGSLSGAFVDRLREIQDAATRLQDLVGDDELASATVTSLVENASSGLDLAGRMNSVCQYRIPRPRTVSVNQVVSDLSGLLPFTTTQAITIDTILGERTGSVTADPAQIEQIVLDLVQLSGQRLPFGGKITLETDNVELLEEYARAHTQLDPGQYVVMTISHAGSVIIPPAGDPEADCVAVAGIVRDLGGDLVIRSEPGRLTTYEIYLPRVDDLTD